MYCTYVSLHSNPACLQQCTTYILPLLQPLYNHMLFVLAAPLLSIHLCLPLQAEFSGGALICNNRVAITRVSDTMQWLQSVAVLSLIRPQSSVCMGWDSVDVVCRYVFVCVGSSVGELEVATTSHCCIWTSIMSSRFAVVLAVQDGAFYNTPPDQAMSIPLGSLSCLYWIVQVQALPQKHSYVIVVPLPPHCFENQQVVGIV